MAINSLKSRNWTDDQWYNFICGLIKEPSSVEPGPEPPTPTVNLGFGFVYICPPNITRNGVSITSANEIYFEIHMYTGQEAYAEDCVSYAFKLSLDTCELTTCQPINRSNIIGAYSFDYTPTGRIVRSWVPSYARLALQNIDMSYAYMYWDLNLQIYPRTTSYMLYRENNATNDARSLAAYFDGGSVRYDCVWFGCGGSLFLRFYSQTTMYVMGSDGSFSNDLYGFGVYAFIQKVIYNGNMTYAGDITMGMSLHSRFIVWMYDLDEQKSYGYEFANPKLRFCMSVAGYVYLTGDYTHRAFVVDGIVTRAYFFDNTITNESIALCVKESSTTLQYSSSDVAVYTMSEYLATKTAASQDEISLLGLYDVAESNVSNLLNARYVALPNMSPLTDSDHLMIVTQELDGLNTFLYSISTGALTEYGTNPDVPEVLPYVWSTKKLTQGVNDPGNVYPAGGGIILYSNSSKAFLAYTTVGASGIETLGSTTLTLGQRAYREAFVIKAGETPTAISYTIYLLDLNSSECTIFMVIILNGQAYFSMAYVGTYSQTIIDRTTSDTYAIDSITSCGNGYAVFWVDETGYIFGNVQAELTSPVITGTYTGKAFVITGDSGSFDGARITMHNNGNFACLYKRCDGGGSRLITATPLANNIVLS